MGQPLVRQLATANDVYVTTRRDLSQPDSSGITYIKGNAKDLTFLASTLKSRHWDAIVDFMVWTTEFPQVLPLMLESTDQYVFISSARVYAQSDEPITEETPRLLDVSEDQEYLSTNEYALAKAREEDMLFRSGRNNFTIVRPYDQAEVDGLNAEINRLRNELAKKPKEVVKEVIKEVKVGGETKTVKVEDLVFVTFAQGKSALTKEAKVALDGVKSGAHVQIVGTASPEGPADLNQRLSQARADVVADYLRGRGVVVDEATGKGVQGTTSNRLAIVYVK